MILTGTTMEPLALEMPVEGYLHVLGYMLQLKDNRELNVLNQSKSGKSIPMSRSSNQRGPSHDSFRPCLFRTKSL